MELQGWDKLYQELAKKVNDNISKIEWIDLWHNQVGFLQEEHLFPTPALFFAFRILKVEDLSENAQEITLQIDMFYFYETFLDTYSGSYNEDDALDYLNNLTAIYKVFHGSNGENYSEMRRTGLAAVDTGSAGNLYRQTFDCTTTDVAAVKNYNTVIPNSLQIKDEEISEVNKEKSFLYNVPPN